MMLQEHHKQVFRDRIQRVASGGHNTMAQVYVGRAGSVAPKAEKPALMSELQVLPMAALTGAIALVLGRLASFHLFSADGAVAAELIPPAGYSAAGILIGIALALVLGKLFRVDKGIRFLALAGGLIAMIWFDKGLVAAYPDIFAMMFSENYVIEMLGLAGQIA